MSFGAAAYSVREGATVEVPVVLGAAHGRAENVEVPVVGSGVSASADDFSVAASVIFAAGETRKTVSLDAVDDDLVEGSETVELSFGALPSGLLAGSTAVTTVTIADADTAAFEFGVASSEVSEGGETELTFAITNGVTFVGDQTISMVVAGSATAGDDFVLVDSQNQPLSVPYLVTLTAGANSVTAVLRVVNDSDEELAETVSLSATLGVDGQHADRFAHRHHLCERFGCARGHDHTGWGRVRGRRRGVYAGAHRHPGDPVGASAHRSRSGDDNRRNSQRNTAGVDGDVRRR